MSSLHILLRARGGRCSCSSRSTMSHRLDRHTNLDLQERKSWSTSNREMFLRLSFARTRFIGVEMDPLSNLAFTTSGALLDCIDSKSLPPSNLQENTQT